MNFDYDGDNDSTSHQATAFVFDSPATTSQVTYTIQVSVGYTSNSGTYYVNRTVNKHTAVTYLLWLYMSLKGV